MRVVSWNLWWRFGDWRRRQGAIASVLDLLQPDLIGLQEVWTGDGTNQAAVLAEHLGMHWALAPSPTPDRWQRRVGDSGLGVANAVLARWPVTAQEVVDLPPAPGGEAERTLLLTQVDAPRGPVPFATTHLHAEAGEGSVRCAQVRAVTSRLETVTAGHPVVLTGDLNAEPGSEEVQLLLAGATLVDAWEQAGTSGPGWTWDASNPRAAVHGPTSARVDVVLVGPAGTTGRGRVHRAQVAADHAVDGVWASDHCAVVVDLQS